MLAYYGPIAQLGERFNGIEEVKGSSPFRSIEAISHPIFDRTAASPPYNQGTWFIGGFCFHTAATEHPSVVQNMKGLYCGKTKAESIG